MRIAIVLGSQRNNGTCSEIESSITNMNLQLEYDFIRMSDSPVSGCIACEKCSKTGKCILPENESDHFEKILNRLVISDVILIITPIYSPYPSRLIALMERLLSISYFPNVYNKRKRPLKNKPTGIICYGSSKIEDERQLKLLFQKFLMDEYSFYDVLYKYLNNEIDPNSKYSNVIEYVKDVIIRISKMNSLTQIST